jgi:hypothetical protein
LAIMAGADLRVGPNPVVGRDSFALSVTVSARDAH